MVKIEKFYQDYVWIISAFSIERSSVDAWEAAVRAYIKHFNNADHRYLIYDLTGIDKISMTTYMQHRITALAQDNRTATGRVAVAMQMTPMLMYVFEPFGRLTAWRLQPHLGVRYFNSREHAFNWVIEILPPEIKNGS